jgi:Phage protein Gp19/Gp15/Gp42
MVNPATVSDLEVRWRPLSDAERSRAEVLLDDAWRDVRRRFPTLEARMTAGALDYMDVVKVVAGMVKRVLIGGDAEGITQQSQTMGPFGVAQSFGNPMGNLYLTAEDVATLRDPALRGARSVRLSAYGE